MTSNQVQEFMQAGYSFLPCGPNKAPWVADWKQYQEYRPEPDDIASMPFLSAPNIAIIAGEVSGGIECIDFDTKHDPQNTIWQEFKDAIKARGLTETILKTTIQSTPSGGYHILYKSPKIEHNQKLALRKDTKDAIIETRGPGGYFLCFPSIGYKVIQGDILQIAEITAAERDALIETCKSLSRQQPGAGPGPRKRSTSRPKSSPKVQKTVEKVVEQLEKTQVDITADYDSWIKVGHALAHQFGEDGRGYYHRLSQFWASGQDIYNPAETDKKFDSLLSQGNKRQPVTIRSFFAIARDYGCDISDDDDHADEVEAWVQMQNFRWNELTCKIEDTYGHPLDDMILNSLWLKCRKHTGKKVSRQIFESTLFNYDNIEPYNPITDYFDRLSTHYYEGSPLDEFLSHITFKDDAWKPFVKKWLMSVVASAYGKKSEMVLVLMGPQGNGKSEFFLRLLPKELEDYLAVNKLDDGKDSDILMTQKLIILDDEFSGKSKKDAKHFKAMASIGKISVRMPYGRVSKDLKRLCVLCGASNSDDIINDNTGNRRIIPVEILDRDYSISDQVDRDDLWAELVQEYFNSDNQNGWFLTKEDMEIIKEKSEDFQATNQERDLIQEYFRPGGDFDEFLTATNVVIYLSEKHPHIKLWPQKVGQELSLLGYKKVARRIKGVPVRGYLVKDISKNAEVDDDVPF